MSRDNWERLVAAVVKREQLWQLFHEQSRSPSISTISSDFSGQILNFPSSSVQPVSATNASVSQVSKNATSHFIQMLFAAWFRRRKAKDIYFDDIPGDEDLGIHSERVRRFSLHDLQVTTENFSQKNVLGNEFNLIYKGKLADGSPVVVKRFKDRGNRSAEVQFQTEVEINSIAVHPNLLHMLGFCITPNERLIVYPLLPNGCVASCLRGRHESQSSLSWSVRKGIALGAARGLAYLHEKCDPQVIHRDVKAANILLDENFKAVVGDFESAIIMDYDVTHANTSLYGTFGHIAPEYLASGLCSVLADVYSYGVFLLELITGLRAFEIDQLANDEQMMSLDWVKRNSNERKWEMMADPYCEGNNMEEVVEQLTQIALLCTQIAPERRPKMLEIIRMLEIGDLLAERWEEWGCNETMMDFADSSWTICLPETPIRADELSGPR